MRPCSTGREKFLNEQKPARFRGTVQVFRRALKCNSRFYLAGNSMAAQTFREKNNNKVESFLKIFFMSTLTPITEKELERVIESKEDEFCWKKNKKIS